MGTFFSSKNLGVTVISVQLIFWFALIRGKVSTSQLVVDPLTSHLRTLKTLLRTLSLVQTLSICLITFACCLFKALKGKTNPSNFECECLIKT